MDKGRSGMTITSFDNCLKTQLNVMATSYIKLLQYTVCKENACTIFWGEINEVVVESLHRNQ